KVVPLNKGDAQPSPTPSATRLPVALTQVRDKAALQLRQALQVLFDNADDTLFEMADRATSNSEQNAFFEAMRHLRLTRKSVERALLPEAFRSSPPRRRPGSGVVRQLAGVPCDSLALGQSGGRAETVARAAMVAKVTTRAGGALGHLAARFNTLVSKKTED